MRHSARRRERSVAFYLLVAPVARYLVASVATRRRNIVGDFFEMRSLSTPYLAKKIGGFTPFPHEMALNCAIMVGNALPMYNKLDTQSAPTPTTEFASMLSRKTAERLILTSPH